MHYYDFWRNDAGGLVKKGYDPTHAYLKLLLEEMRPDGRLGELTNADLRDFGRTLDDDFYPGVPEVFDDLRRIVSEAVGMSIEFFIVSSGLEDVMLGSEIVQKYFRGVYGCLLAGDTDDGPLRYIRRAVTFSEKTRFLFEINKGIPASESLANPLLVNKDVQEEARPIPFENMIYLGDGLTDIPCFSLLENSGGKAFGILQEEKIAGKSALSEMLGPRRARSLNAPKFGEPTISASSCERPSAASARTSCIGGNRRNCLAPAVSLTQAGEGGVSGEESWSLSEHAP